MISLWYYYTAGQDNKITNDTKNTKKFTKTQKIEAIGVISYCLKIM